MRNSTAGRRRAAQLAAGLLVLAVAAGCTSKVAVHGTSAPPAASARTAAYLAMLNLSAASAVRYRGTFADGGDTLDLDATVTSSGEATGTIGVGTTKIAVLVLQGATYIKAPEAYWTSGGAPKSGITARYAANWVRVPAMIFGLDLGAALAPGALARWQQPVVGAVADQPVGQATGDVVRVPAQNSFFELTAKQPYRLVRLHAGSVPDLTRRLHRFTAAGPVVAAGPVAAGPVLARPVIAAVPPKPGTPVPPAPAASDLEVTLADVSGTLPAVYAQLTRQATQLGGAIDGEGRITLGKQQFVGCGATGCTITVGFTNASGRPIRAGLHADWDGDSKPIGVCDSVTGLVAAAHTATATCTITSAGWRTFYNRAISSARGLPYGARYSVLPLAGTADNRRLGTDAATARCGGGAARPANCAAASPASSEARDAAVRAAYAALTKRFGQGTPYGAVTTPRLLGVPATVPAANGYPDLLVYFGDRAFLYKVTDLSHAAQAKQQLAAQLAAVRGSLVTGGTVEPGPELGRITMPDPRLRRTVQLISLASNPGVIIYTIS